MPHTIDPHTLYSDAKFFLDYIEANKQTADFFQHSGTSLFRLAEARETLFSPQTRAEVCDALLGYNQWIDAPDAARQNVQRLRDPKALCVIGGQQAGFLGGPLFVLYKIASIIRTAAHLSEQLNLPVVPVFWLASEDHDFAEINHMRWMDESGALRTISFDWEGEGRPIESLPITAAVSQAYREANEKMTFSVASDSDLFSPVEGDNYCTWHARVWSRLFAKHGLILVEPRVLRSAATPLFQRVLAERVEIQHGLTDSSIRLRNLGYPVPLDPNRSGTLFEILEDSGMRQLLTQEIATFASQPNRIFSSDAATRPLIVDSLLPTIANILGPSELAYHAMLRPLYEQWDIPQPLAIPRNGATVIPARGLQSLTDWGIDVAAMLLPNFNPADIVKNAASENLRSQFTAARDRIGDALMPLRSFLAQIDPGLETRWHQTVDQARYQVDRLEDRAIRADLARRGLSVKALQNLKPWLLPMDKPQERILSAFSFIARYGIKWIDDMIAHGELHRFEHQLIVLEESHEQG
ncbi:bacillithiol biosynthesis cysteine-adding enzyme BshC [Candidatus Bipolaricaulota bacterium]|nr:bacillithiol biosynthesis cysteine-adding enzyme BshC [Candidatus Bipolaricaulota bacterium]